MYICIWSVVITYVICYVHWLLTLFLFCPLSRTSSSLFLLFTSISCCCHMVALLVFLCFLHSVLLLSASLPLYFRLDGNTFIPSTLLTCSCSPLMSFQFHSAFICIWSLAGCQLWVPQNGSIWGYVLPAYLSAYLNKRWFTNLN